MGETDEGQARAGQGDEGHNEVVVALHEALEGGRGQASKALHSSRVRLRMAAAMASRIDKTNLTPGEKDLLRKIQPPMGL